MRPVAFCPKQSSESLAQYSADIEITLELFMTVFKLEYPLFHRIARESDFRENNELQKDAVSKPKYGVSKATGYLTTS